MALYKYRLPCWLDVNIYQLDVAVIYAFSCQQTWRVLFSAMIRSTNTFNCTDARYDQAVSPVGWMYKALCSNEIGGYNSQPKAV